MIGRLSTHALVRFWDVHTWAGVVGGLVLYVMFLTGGVTLFREQLELWEEPRAQRSAPARSMQSWFERGLRARGSTPDELWFYPPRGARGEARLVYHDASAAKWRTDWIDSNEDALSPERERLSGFLYSIHFLWHDATGQLLYTLAGLLAVALLLAIVTGVLIHIKDLVRQLHQFRIDKSRRVLWSDMHKVLGVMGLPFQLMYAYTGAFIVLAPLLLQVFVGPVFGGDAARASQLGLGPSRRSVTSDGPVAAVLTLDALAHRARAVRPELAPETFRVVRHGHADGIVEMWGRDRQSPGGRASVRLREMDGEPLDDDGARLDGSSSVTRRWIQGLHFAHFGGPLVRALLLLLALATCLTIVSGNLIWLSRRESRRQGLGNRVLARLTVGVGAGAWVALGALFLASRLFPLGWSGRGSAEELTFVAVLGGCMLWALVARDERSLCWKVLATAGLLFLPVPFLAARWSHAGLFGTGSRVVAVVVVDLALLATAMGLLVGAWVLRRTAAESAIAFLSAEPRPPMAARVAAPSTAVFTSSGARDV